MNGDSKTEGIDMIKCTYCGHENSELVVNCAGCGQALGSGGDEAGVDLADANFKVAVVRAYATETSARLALGALTHAGFPAFLGADDCGGMLPTLQQGKGLRLMVNADDLERATAWLDEWESAPPLEEGAAMSPPPPLPPFANN